MKLYIDINSAHQDCKIFIAKKEIDIWNECEIPFSVVMEQPRKFFDFGGTKFGCLRQLRTLTLDKLFRNDYEVKYYLFSGDLKPKGYKDYLEIDSQMDFTTPIEPINHITTEAVQRTIDQITALMTQNTGWNLTADNHNV